MFTETIQAPAGSYNSLTHQVAFCKMQVRARPARVACVASWSWSLPSSERRRLLPPSYCRTPPSKTTLSHPSHIDDPNPTQGYDTVSRETSAGPSVFTSGLVKIGVGLAHSQFGSRMESSTWKDLVRCPETGRFRVFTFVGGDGG
jgi:hypothetical protein